MTSETGRSARRLIARDARPWAVSSSTDIRWNSGYARELYAKRHAWSDIHSPPPQGMAREAVKRFVPANVEFDLEFRVVNHRFGGRAHFITVRARPAPARG